VACFLMLAVTARAMVQSSLRHKAGADGFVRALQFKHQLRICNAYPYSTALDVYNGRQKLSGDPMPYKSCKDFTSPLKAGDKLDFRVGDANAGTFSVSDLPENDATLVLVIHRHDTLSTAVSFESHVFASLDNAQVAVIDTYKGMAQSSPKIKDAASKKAKTSRIEDLRYNSVVAVSPGQYEVELLDKKDKVIAKRQLVALKQECYLIMRTGVESQQGKAYPEELVVYPDSDPKMLPSGSVTHSVLVAVGIALFATVAV